MLSSPREGNRCVEEGARVLTIPSRRIPSGPSWSHMVDSLWLRASDGSPTDAPSTLTVTPQDLSTLRSKSSTVTQQTAPKATPSKSSCNGSN